MTERLVYECLLQQGQQFPLPEYGPLMAGPGLTRVRVFVETFNEVPTTGGTVQRLLETGEVRDPAQPDRRKKP